MIKREVFKFFNIKEKIIPENVVEDLFIEKMDGWTEEKGVFAFYLIDNYKSSYSLDFKQKILSYLSMVLLNPDVVSQSSFVQEAGLLVLMKRILDECDLSYQRVYDCLKDLAEYGDEESAMKILIPLIYQCSKEASKLNLLENFAKYLNAVMMLITIEKVQVWFCDEFIWVCATLSCSMAMIIIVVLCTKRTVRAFLTGSWRYSSTRNRIFYMCRVFHVK
ncbi:hypothetical protein VCUG_02159 [Vavraia culicis subsp. floridensis]|uniref:Uncharacterized protein n=1 Tax=Vavraia culicis (isolate floridensis) TaxID=948595 RepID=L2GRU2_VAVCU|nr:uncharacterized protein VCUG_02159 [Vavraia culicis subsp. floridensis]ELA46354.1 hypothetical protein VCUG_02159 [Vavraia culicis subsp. floridensis]